MRCWVFLLEYSGATLNIARGVIRLLGGRFPGLALAIIGYLVSIPIYCDSGFILLNGIRKHLVMTHNASPVFLSTVLGTALYATHTLVPPTPGPLAGAANLQLSDHLSLVILSGMAVSVLAVVVGFLWGLYAQRYSFVEVKIPSQHHQAEELPRNDQVSVWWSSLPVIVPIVLITVAGVFGKDAGAVAEWIAFSACP